MGKRAEVKTEMTAEMLYERYRRAKDPVERTHWHMLWQVKEGKSPQEVAEVFGYTAGWVRKMIRRWNAAGEAGITDHRRHPAWEPNRGFPQSSNASWLKPCSSHQKMEGYGAVRK